MLILGFAHNVNIFFRGLVLGALIIPINGYINMVYKTMLAIANTQILSSEAVFRIFNNIQMILAVFMIFRLMISIIQMIISPESGKNQEGNFMGVSKFSIIIKRILLGLILIVLLRPVNIPVSNTGGEGENRLNQYVHNNGIIFGVLYDLQYRILNNHNIECIISDRNCGEVGEIEDENSDENPASSFAAYVVSSFVTPNFDEKVENPDRNNKDDWICHKSTNSDLIDEYNNGMEPSRFLSSEVYKADCDVDDGYFTFDYNYLILLIVLIVVAFILTGFLIDIGIRSIKLTILRLISPIPVISYMSNEKDQILNNWVKNLVSTYVDLFIRLAILFLGFDLISQITSGDAYLSSSEIGIFTKVIISVTLLIFLRMAPKYIMDLLGIKGSGSNIGLSAMASGLGALRQGGKIGDVRDAMVDSVQGSTQAYNQGKQMLGVGNSFVSGKDMMARRLTGNARATAKDMREGQRRARRMQYQERLKLADENLNSKRADLNDASALTEYYKNAGWDGLTDEQKNNVMSNGLSENDALRLNNLMTQQQQGHQPLTADQLNDMKELQQRAITGNQAAAEAAVAKAEKDKKAIKELEDNLLINRTSEYRDYPDREDGESRIGYAARRTGARARASLRGIPNRLTGHDYGATGTAGNIRRGGNREIDAAEASFLTGIGGPGGNP